MQDILYRSPAIWTHRKYASNGALSQILDQPSSGKYEIRTSTGFTGPFPTTKPLPPHAYHINCQSIHARQSALYNYYTSGGTFTGSEVGEGPTLAPVVNGALCLPAFTGMSALENEALLKLSGKVRGDLDLSVDLAESGKTLQMMKLSDRLVDYTRTFTRRFGVIRVASKLWLEYTYGVKPLLSSIYGLADENLRVVINKVGRYTARASTKHRVTGVRLNTVFGTVTYETNTDQKVSVTYGMDLNTDQFDIGRFSSLNPISIAWELLPASFVVDWVFNVGGYLRSMETYLLYANKFRHGYKTVLSVSDMNFGLTQIVNTTTQKSSSIHTGHLKGVDITRSVLSSYPAPSLPSFNAKLGSSRLISAAALLGQMLGRR